MDDQEAGREVETLILRQALDAWDAWYRALPWDPGAALEERRHLLAPERVRAAYDAGDALLGRYLLWQSVALRTRPAVDRYMRARSTVAVRQADRTLLTSDVGLALATTPDREARRRLWEDFVPVLRLSAPAFLAVLEATAEAGREHGHPDGFALACALTRIAPGEAVATAEDVLRRTADAWRAGMAELAAARDVPAGDVRPEDLSWLLRPGEHLAGFAAVHALPLVGRTFKALGLDLTAQSGVETLEDPHGDSGRPPRAFPVRAPGDVRIGVAPRDGLPWFRDFFAEVGRAQQLAHCAPGRALDNFPLGLRAITDGIGGRVVARWLADPAYLTANGLPAGPAAAVGAHARVEALHELRAAATSVLWHADMARGEDPARAWAARALVPPASDDGAEALPDRMDAVYALDTLQLRLVADAVTDRLRADHGERWWWSKDAGAALLSIWSAGQRTTATEWIARLR